MRCFRTPRSDVTSPAMASRPRRPLPGQPLVELVAQVLDSHGRASRQRAVVGPGRTMAQTAWST